MYARSVPRYDAAWYVNAGTWVLLLALAIASLYPGSPDWLILAFCVVTLAGTIAYATLVTRHPKALVPSDGHSGPWALVQFGPLVLELSALLRFHIVDWQWLFAASAVLGLPLTYRLGFGLFRKRTHLAARALMSCFLCYLGPGSLIFATLTFSNGLWVHAPERIEERQVLEKNISHGRSSTTYSVQLATPQELKGIEDFRVSQDTYDRLGIGRWACIGVYRGNLGLRWYRVWPCP